MSTMICNRPGCESEAVRIIEGERLCLTHSIAWREDKLKLLRVEFSKRSNDIWYIFFNSNIPAGELDENEKSI